MTAVTACLVDVYETLVSYDFGSHSRKLSELAGADLAAWQAAQVALTPDFDAGRLTIDAAMTRLLSECGIEASPELTRRLARADAEWTRSGCAPYPEAVEFLRALRARNTKIALVSNCGADTRPMLERMGLIDLADESILSCEVGTPKPAPEIYHRALDALGVPAGEAVMIDDQPSYCAGAEAAGVRAIQVTRPGGAAPDPRFPGVSGLLEVLPLLD
jgi:putative hydrolase of the HAD superfamily